MGILKLYRGGQIALHKDYIHLNSQLESIGEHVSYILANSGGTKPLAFATCMSQTSCSYSVCYPLEHFRLSPLRCQLFAIWDVVFSLTLHFLTLRRVLVSEILARWAVLVRPHVPRFDVKQIRSVMQFCVSPSVTYVSVLRECLWIDCPKWAESISMCNFEEGRVVTFKIFYTSFCLC